MLACIAYSASSKPIFDNSQNDISPYDVKDWIVAYLDGFGISKYSNATGECKGAGGDFYQYVFAGVKNYLEQKYFDGTLNITDALAEFSPLSRSCYNTSVDLSIAFAGYLVQFDGLSDYSSKIMVNFLDNFKIIKDTATIMVAEWITSRNITKIAFYAGQITSYILVIEENSTDSTAPLKYTEFDPFAANPMNKYVWDTFEGLYKFMLNSKLANETNTKHCQEGILNLAYLNEKAVEYYFNGDNVMAWFSFADSLSFTRQIFEGCYYTTLDTAATVKKIKEQIIDQGKIGDNLKANLYQVISGVVGSWSQVYYYDWINLLGQLGDLTFRTFVYGLE